MRWESERRSDNVEDRRGLISGRGAVGGGAVLIAVIAALFGAPSGLIRDILGVGTGDGADPSATTEPGARRATDPQQDKQADFVSVVLAETEDTWDGLFAARGRRYQRPRLVLFSDAVDSACGFATAAVGPFYCP